MTPSAHRTRLYRARRRQGLAVFRLVLPEAGVADLVTGAGLVSLSCADDHACVEAALRRVVEGMIETEGTG